jgi:hypothetical protein
MIRAENAFVVSVFSPCKVNECMSKTGELYNRDYRAWANRQIDALSAGRFTDLDIAHLLEELGDMGRSERNELENRLVVLLAHLLKWQFQYDRLTDRWKEFKGDSWRSTIVEQRDRIARRLDKSPRLKPELSGLIEEAYNDAAGLAAKETAIHMDCFPSVCPYTQEQILDEKFFPEHSDSTSYGPGSGSKGLGSNRARVKSSIVSFCGTC